MSNPSGDDRPAVLAVGTLIKAHGVRGEMKIRSTPEHLAVLRDVAAQAVAVTLRIPASGDEYEVTLAHVRGHDSAAIVAIDGVEDRDAADAFRTAQVCVPRELLPVPSVEEGEYFLADLDGCTVHDSTTGAAIGRVTRAEQLPANVVLTIQLDTGGTVLAPFVDDAVPTVDVDARRLDLNVAFLGLDEDT